MPVDWIQNIAPQITIGNFLTFYLDSVMIKIVDLMGVNKSSILGRMSADILILAVSASYSWKQRSL